MNSNNQWEGQGEVKLGDGGEVAGEWRAGERWGRGSCSSPAAGLRLLVGTYRASKLGGRGRLVWEDGETVEGHFREGCLHGLAVSRVDTRLRIGRYRAGRPVGKYQIQRGV